MAFCKVDPISNYCVPSNTQTTEGSKSKTHGGKRNFMTRRRRGGSKLSPRAREAPRAVEIKKFTRQTLDIAISSIEDSERRYGPINTWDVSDVTDMSRLFASTPNFNKNINDWNVSNVTNMRAMFENARDFNQPLNNWNVGNVTNMHQMFANARDFNQPLNNWNVSNVTNMQALFANTRDFNQPLNNWNVGNVTDMARLFMNTHKFNQPLNNWNVGNVTNMKSMFENARDFNQPLDNWDVGNVNNMEGMFANAAAFTQPLNNWRLQQGVDIRHILEHIPQLRRDTIRFPFPPDDQVHGDGDEHFHFHDYGVANQAVGVEVHTAFRTINLPRYTKLLTERLNEIGDIIMPFDLSVMENIMGSAVNERHLPQLMRLFKRLKTVQRNVPDYLKQAIVLSVSWMWSTDFDDDAREIYATAWAVDVPNSCMQGIIERFVTSIKQIIEVMPENDRNGTQMEILALMSPPEVSDVYKVWRNEILKHEPELYNLAESIRMKTNNGDKDVPVLDDDVKNKFRNSFAAYFREVLNNYYGVAVAATKLSEKSGFVDYVAESVQNGGKRRKRRKRKRITMRKSRKCRRNRKTRCRK